MHPGLSLGLKPKTKVNFELTTEKCTDYVLS